MFIFERCLCFERYWCYIILYLILYSSLLPNHSSNLLFLLLSFPPNPFIHSILVGTYISLFIFLRCLGLKGIGECFGVIVRYSALVDVLCWLTLGVILFIIHVHYYIIIYYILYYSYYILSYTILFYILFLFLSYFLLPPLLFLTPFPLLFLLSSSPSSIFYSSSLLLFLLFSSDLSSSSSNPPPLFQSIILLSFLLFLTNIHSIRVGIYLRSFIFHPHQQF